MKIKGRILKVYPIRKGQRQDGTEWQSQEFVLEYFENETDRFSDKVVLSVMNEKVDEYNLQPNEEVEAVIGHQYNEYNGRPYNTIRLYQLTKLNAVNSTNNVKDQGAAAPAAASPQTNEDDDLPF